MPVEITLPLSKLEQAVADARAHQQLMEAKVEDAKLTLKAAKTAWEESVGALNLAVDEMIRDKRQPSLPFDEADDDAFAGRPESTPPAPAPAGTPVACEVEIISPMPAAQTVEVAFDEVKVEVRPLVLAGGPVWRALVVAEHLEGPAALFDTLAVFGVTTMGELADALKEGRTFNLKLTDLDDLHEAIEQVSANDAEPITFGRETTADTENEAEAFLHDAREEVAAQTAAGGNSDVLSNLFATATEPEPPAAEPAEPAKPAKRGRGKKKVAEPEPPVLAESPANAVPTTLDLNDL